jgi:hypothetical protein
MRHSSIARSLALTALAIGPLVACSVKDSSDNPPQAAVAVPVAVPVATPTKTDSVSTTTSTSTVTTPGMVPVTQSTTSTRLDSTGAVVRTDSSATTMAPVGPTVTSKTRTTTKHTTTTP